MRSILLILGVLALAAPPARGDEVRLKNGSVIHGRIVSEAPDAVVVDLGRGRMSIPRREIAGIIRAEPIETEVPPSNLPPRPTRRATEAPPTPTPAAKSSPPRQPIAPAPRKRRDRGGPEPRIVPLDRANPRLEIASVGPERAAPSRKSATRMPDTESAAGSASPGASRPAATKTDW